jgi:hypothetical protein
LKKTFSYFLFALLPAVTLLAQTKEAYHLPFQDSVRVTLENNQNTETSMVGGVFATAWHKITLDQQQVILRQVKLMQKKKFRVFPVMVDS